MAVSPASRHAPRDNLFTNVGVVGRKTGLTVSDIGRDEDGMEEMSEFFSPGVERSPSDSSADEIVHTINHPGSLFSAIDKAALPDHDRSASMDLNQSTVQGPNMVLTARRQRSDHVPSSKSPRRSSPAPMGLFSPPRRNPASIRHISSQNMPRSRSRSRLTSSPARKLNFLNSPIRSISGSPRRPPPVAKGSIPFPNLADSVDLADEVEGAEVLEENLVSELIIPTGLRSTGVNLKESINRSAASMKLKAQKGLLSQQGFRKPAGDNPGSLAEDEDDDDDDSDLEPVNAVSSSILRKSAITSTLLKKQGTIAYDAEKRIKKDGSARPKGLSSALGRTMLRSIEGTGAAKSSNTNREDNTGGISDAELAESEDHELSRERKSKASLGHNVRTGKKMVGTTRRDRTSITVPVDKKMEMDELDASDSDTIATPKYGQELVNKKTKHNIGAGPPKKITGKRTREMQDVSDKAAPASKKLQTGAIKVTTREEPHANALAGTDLSFRNTLKTGRGRPKKLTEAAVVEVEAEDDADQEIILVKPKPRGRPKKPVLAPSTEIATGNFDGQKSEPEPDVAIVSPRKIRGRPKGTMKPAPVVSQEQNLSVLQTQVNSKKLQKQAPADPNSNAEVETGVEDNKDVDPPTPPSKGKRIRQKASAPDPKPRNGVRNPVTTITVEETAADPHDDENEPIARNRPSLARRGRAKKLLQAGTSDTKSKPKTAAPHRITKEPMKNIILKETIEESINADGLTDGRPQRSRITPLQFWKNEAIIYKVGARRASGSAATLIKEIIRVEDEEPKKVVRRSRPAAGAASRRGDIIRSKAAKARIDAETETVEESELEENEDWEVGGTLTCMVTNYPSVSEEDEYEDEEVVAISRYAIEPRAVLGSDYKFYKAFGNDFMGSGILEFKEGATKRMKSSGRMHYFFYITQGKVEAEINGMAFRIGVDGQFQVPRGNNYQISNPFKGTAKVYFVQACVPEVDEERE